MELTVEDMNKIITALGTYMDEYGASQDTEELLGRVRAARGRRREEIRKDGSWS